MNTYTMPTADYTTSIDRLVVAGVNPQLVFNILRVIGSCSTSDELSFSFITRHIGLHEYMSLLKATDMTDQRVGVYNMSMFVHTNADIDHFDTFAALERAAKMCLLSTTSQSVYENVWTAYSSLRASVGIPVYMTPGIDVEKQCLTLCVGEMHNLFLTLFCGEQPSGTKNEI